MLETNIQKPASQQTFQQRQIQKMARNQTSKNQQAIRQGAGGRGEALRSAAPRSEVAGRAKYEDQVLCIAATRLWIHYDFNV